MHAIRKILQEAAAIGSACAKYRVDPVSMASRYWRLYRARLFSPHEIRFFTLLDPAVGEAELARIVSKEELVRVQARLNPPAARQLTEDKTRFRLHCERAGLPVPRVLAVFDPQGDEDGDAPSLSDASALGAFLATTPSDRLIFKPVNGVNGEGITRLDRIDGSWLDTHGRPTDAALLAGQASASGYRRWMLQEFVEGHPELRRLSRTGALQTIRAVTAIDDSGEVRLLATRLRLVCGDVPFDNFNYGSTGNVIANVDIETGRIFSVVGLDPQTHSLRFLENHPATGERLIGYCVPQWEQVRALALRAGRAFPMLRTVGWDIGIALPEPSLIEGNATWGILSGEPRMGELYRYLRSLDPSLEFTEATVR